MPTVLCPNFSFPAHRTGDTFRELRFKLKQAGSPIDLNGADILFQVRLAPLGTLTLEFSVGDGITILDAADGSFCIDKQIIAIPSALYYYELQVTTSDGFRLTYLTGTWQIIQDVAR